VSNIISITQMIIVPVTKEIRELSEERYQLNILNKEGLKDPVGESKRHAYVCTAFEDWARRMGIRHCDFITGRVDWNADLITQGFKNEVKTKNIEWKKVKGLYSQMLGPTWSILIPTRPHDQISEYWIFGGCYDNYTTVELFGWLTEKRYKEVRGEPTKPGTMKYKLKTDTWNYEVNFRDMYPMEEFINLFIPRNEKR